MPTPTPKYFKAWFVFFLIATVGGFFVGAIIGGLIGGVMGVAGYSVTAIKIAAGGAGFLLGVPLSYFTFRWSVAEFIVKELAQQTAAAQANPSMPPPIAQP